MIELKDVTKVYGKGENTFTALSDINLSINSGQTVAIIGKSGSGKSTLMHIMSGLDRPTEGIVSISGKNLHALRGHEMDQFRAKQMSFIFQAFFVEPNQSCYQNVVLPLEIAAVPAARRKSMVINALKRVGLDDKVNQLARNLSGGQKQRLAIARAIVNKPKLIFADEPTGNLDTTTGDNIVKLLFELNKNLGCTLIIVTHDHDLAKKCRQQVQLSDGKIVLAKNKGKKK